MTKNTHQTPSITWPLPCCNGTHRWLPLVVGLLCLSVGQGLLQADERLLDRSPFDQVILDSANKSAVLEVFLLDLPGRHVPSPPPRGSLSLRLLAKPTESFEVAWGNIAKIRFYEQMLLDEARQLTQAGKFDEAYDYFAHLQNNHPTQAGLGESINDYLRRNALALYKMGQHDRALALLAALMERDTQSPGLTQAVDSVAGKILQQHLRQQRFAAARSVLNFWKNQFGALKSTAADEWQQRFATAAKKHLKEATRLADQKQHVAARKAIGKALAIWPDLQAAKELHARIQQEHPFVAVGVWETSPPQPQGRLDHWASLRAHRLVSHTLTELVGFGSEGGLYRSPYGELLPGDSGLRLSLQLDPRSDQLTADSLARHLLAMADPIEASYRSDYSARLAGVSIGKGGRIDIDWSRPHVRPEALLQVSPKVSGGRFRLANSRPDSLVFEANAQTQARQGLLKAIVERRMDDDDAAVEALLAGEIDILDHVPPWQIARLQAAPGITVHVLIPNMSRPLPAAREFRRALCYGLQRERIVRQILLGGTPRSGFQVLTGPFPVGVSLSDPIRYAYNNQLVARPFEPRLAAILATVAWSNVLQTKKKKGSQEEEEEEEIDIPPLPELVLAHPTDPLARIACQSIQLQLKRVGILVRLRPFEPKELLHSDESLEYDFRYAELAMWEPVTDARRLLGPDGLAGCQSPMLHSALRQLEEAINWKDVRARLTEIHDIAYHDLPVVPLWQTVNHFAYRESLHGIGERPVTLYQNVDQWELSTGEARD